MSTVRQLSLKLLPESGEADSDIDHLAKMDSWVISTLNEIAIAYDWDCLLTKETITTVVSQAEYSLSVAAADIKKVRIPVDDLPLDIVDEDDLEGYNLEEEGTLLCVYRSGYDTATKQDKIKFFMVPSAIQDVEFTEKLRIDEEVYTSDDEVPFPTDFNELIKTGVKWKIADSKLKFQMVGFYKKMFDDMLEQKKGSAMSLGTRLVRQVSDLPRRKWQWGLRRDPAHYRNDI